jgi:hypothetical protein
MTPAAAPLFFSPLFFHPPFPRSDLSGLTRLVAASYALAALACLARVHFTLYQRITTHARAHVVAEAERQARAGAGGAAAGSASLEQGGGGGGDGKEDGGGGTPAGPRLPTPREAAAAAGVAYDRIAQERQEQCLRALCDVLLGEGLEALVRHVSATVRLATGTPAYSVTGEGGRATTIRRLHFRGLMDALAGAAEPPPLNLPPGLPQGSADYSPCLVLSLLLPATRSVRADAAAAAAAAASGARGGGGMAASALVALATSRSPAAASAAATAGLLPVPWSSQLLLDLTLDAVRSPPAQAGLRHAARSLVAMCVHPSVDRVVFGGGGSAASAAAAANAAPAASDSERALGPVVMALRGVTDELLQASAPEAGSPQGAPAPAAAVAAGGSDPVSVACACPPLSELCFQLMWHAKLA